MEPPLELFIGGDKCSFCVDFEMAAKIDHGKQQVAIFLFDISAFLCRHCFLELCGFLGDLVENRCRFRPVESDFRSLLLKFQGAQQGGEGLWNIIQEAVLFCRFKSKFERRSARSAFSSALMRFHDPLAMPALLASASPKRADVA